jgi:hypothetical protein
LLRANLSHSISFCDVYHIESLILLPHVFRNSLLWEPLP